MGRCKHCKERFKPIRSTLEKYCTKDECIDASIKEAVKKAKNKNNKEWNGRKKKMKESLKTKEDYFQDALKVFNEYIRLRDKDKPCISCGAVQGTYKITSGHYYPQGSYRNIALDEMNAHGQCWWNCNSNKSGNLIEYRKGFIERYGEEEMDKLEQRRLDKAHFTIPELILIKEEYKQKVKRFK